MVPHMIQWPASIINSRKMIASILESLGLQLTVLDIPGHTSGHIAYYGNGMLFCGDTLFAAGCGRIFEGTAEQMYESLCKLQRLPDTTLVYCAHEYTAANLRFADDT